jgi:N-acetylneuraminic acid mutarotase
MRLRLIGVIFCLGIAELSYSNVWEQKANFGGTGRHRGTAFSVHNKGYIGLGHINSVTETVYEDIWEYDPASDTWTQKADFGGGPRYHPTTFSIGGKAYCGTGRSLTTSAYDDFWEFDPTMNTWTQITSFPGEPRSGAVAFVVDSIAYVGSGTVAFTGSNNFYAYNSVSDSWSAISSFPGVARNTGVAITINDKGYFGTGSGTYGSGNDFWEYKPAQDQWIQRANVGNILRQGATGFSINGKGYILTGNNFGIGENFRDVWEYEPSNNSWREVASFPGAKRRFMVSFVINDIAYCGIGTNGLNFNDFWSYSGTVGLYSEHQDELEIAYPNPTNSKINFNLTPALTKAKLSLYNLSGKLVDEIDFKELQSIDCSNLPSGVYIYKVFNAEMHLGSGKVIVL